MTEVRIAVVLATRQNAFFAELATAVVDGFREIGTWADLVIDRFPDPEPGVVPLFLPPHEVAALGGWPAMQDAELLARSIAICAEQPTSSWFEGNVPLVSRMGAVYDLSELGVQALGRRGIMASRLDLGHVPAWDGCLTDDADGRDLDVVFLGCTTPRRQRLLSACGELLARYRTVLVLSDNTLPNTHTSASFVSGQDKRALLRRTRIVLNLHRDDEPYMEWLRTMDVLHAGAVLVTDSSADLRDLVPGEHLVVSRPESLPQVLAHVLADDDGARRMREASLSWLRDRPLSASLRPLVEQARVLATRPWSTTPPPFETVTLTRPASPPVAVGDPTRVALKRSVLEGISLRRRLSALEQTVAGDSLSIEVVASTPAWSGPHRRTSVIVPTFRHADALAGALGSVLRQRHADLELVIVDDGSPLPDAAVATAFAAEHPDLPMLIVRHPINRGLGSARNTGAGLGTGDLLLMLDADNELLPGAVQRLVGALDDDPQAPLAYGLLATWSPTTGPVALLSDMPWQPARLVEQNYVDALALIRRSTLEALGGYTDDLALYGWEDYDLWLGVADAGLVPAFVPEVIARYRVDPTSMLSVANISHDDAYARFIERHPVMAR